jgi:putative membrane protein
MKPQARPAGRAALDDPPARGRRNIIDRRRLNILSLLLGLAGILLAVWLIVRFGVGRIAHATLSVGIAGFAAVCAWQMALFAALGLCWFVLRPAGPRWRLWVAIWGRMVRDAAGGLLPFSLFGGFVLGARAVTLHGVAWPDAAASTVVDLTAEFLAQIGLVLIGLLLLSARAPHAAIILPVTFGLMVAMLSGASMVWLQRRGTAPLARVSRRLLAHWGRAGDADAVRQALAAIYAAPWRVALCTALHLLAWFGTGLASWIAFRLLGAAIDFATALGIEALLHAVLATAILVPGYAGVQEATYAAVGALFGQPAALCLGVSLLRRARDITLGVPILLVWQCVELRRAVAPRPAGRS